MSSCNSQTEFTQIVITLMVVAPELLSSLLLVSRTYCIIFLYLGLEQKAISLITCNTLVPNVSHGGNSICVIPNSYSSFIKSICNLFQIIVQESCLKNCCGRNFLKQLLEKRK